MIIMPSRSSNIEFAFFQLASLKSRYDGAFVFLDDEIFGGF